MMTNLRLKKTCLTVAIGLANISLVQAEEAPLESNPIAETAQLDSVQVWGTSVKASSINMENDDITLKQADHISDLLRFLPGVDVGGSHSLNQRITIRSMDDKDLRISIDGANQNTYMYHHMGNLQIHADILQSVDIDVGTNSVVNGGLGGSVRFETKDAQQLLAPGQEFGARIQGSYSDNASTGYSLTGYGLIGSDVDFLAYFNHVNRDNYTVGGGEIQDSNGDEVPDTDGDVKGLKGELDDALLKLGWNISENQRLELGYESYNDEGDYSYRPDMGLATDIAIGDFFGLPLTYDTQFSRQTLTLNHEFKLNNHTFKTAVYKNDSQLERDESALGGTYNKIEGIASNKGVNLLASSTFEGAVSHTLTYGLDSIKYDTEYKGDGVKQSSESATNHALFIEDRLDINDVFAVIPGIRYESADISSTLTDDTFSKTTGSLAAEVRPTNDLVFKASSTQLFKAPELAEVFIGAGLNDTENPDIKAETGINHELAVAFEKSLSNSTRISTGATFFQTTINDYIYDAAAGTYSKDNIGDMEVNGYEAYANLSIGALNTLLTYSHSESELDADAEHIDNDGAALNRTQGDTISLAIDYDIYDLGLTLHWDSQFVDDLSDTLYLDGANSSNAKDGFDLHNISVRWAPPQHDQLALTFGIDNVFDTYYASQSSRTGVTVHPAFGELYLTDYEPGRNIKFTVSYEI